MPFMAFTRTARLPHLLALAVGIAALICGGAVGLYQQTRQNAAYAAEFEDLTEEFEAIIAERLRRYEYGLRGARGAVMTAWPERISRRQFEQYTTTRDLAQEFPGARGVGYILRIPAAEVPAFVTDAQADGFPGFAIRELQPHDGERFVITYLYPSADNSSAVGLDIASEASRRDAALTAMRGGSATLTAPITLVQASGQSNAGFLLLLPVYATGFDPGLPSLREGALIGWTYSPLVITEILRDMGPRQREASFTLQDIGADATFFRSDESRTVGARLGLPHASRQIDIYGRTWMIDITATPEFARRHGSRVPEISAAIVIGIGFMIAALVFVVARSYQRQQVAHREQEQLANSLPHLVWTCDPEGSCTFLSEQWVAYTGIPEEPQLGTGWLEQVHPADRAALTAAWQHSVDTGTAFVTEFRIRRHDGVYRLFYTRAEPIRGETGAILRWIGSNTDIEDRSQAERRVRVLLEEMEGRVAARTADLDRANRDLKNILNSIPSMIAYWDRNQINRFTNNARDNWFSIEPAQMVGRHLRDLLGEKAYAESLPYIQAALRGERQMFERDMIDAQGRAHTGQVNYVPDIQDGKVLGFYALIFDISNRRAAERAQAAALEAAEQATRAKSVFLTSMSHELRTPMNSILGFSDLLLGQFYGKLNEKQTEYAALIRQSGEHLLKLLDEILELSKIESGRVKISIEPIGVAGIIKSAAANLQPLAEKYRVSIDTRNVVAEDLMISADLTRMAQVLINLGSNAIKYNRPGGWVKFSCQPQPDNTLRILVSDNGRGIPQDRQAEAFQIFNRLGAEHGSIEGTGIGLSLVKSLVEMMGGRIGFRSQEGEGSTFWVDMPMAVSDSVDVRSEDLKGDAAPALPPLNDARILYVEDNENNRTLFRQYMSVLKGVTIVEAADGPGGLVAARTWMPDLIFLDINLPGMSGFDILEELKADASLRHIPVVALTANAMEGDAERGLERGFTRYLTKPVRLEEMMRTVYDLLQPAAPTA
jgi:PAS domain S-box-containing protein